MSEQITSEEFDIWLDSPVTQWVLSGLAKLAERQEAVWKDAAWAGNFDPFDHARCKALADANRDLSTVTYDEVLNAHDDGAAE